MSPITPVSQRVVYQKGQTIATDAKMQNERTPAARNPRIAPVGLGMLQSATMAEDVSSPFKMAVMCGVSPSSFDPVPLHAFSRSMDFQDWMIDYLEFAENLTLNDNNNMIYTQSARV